MANYKWLLNNSKVAHICIAIATQFYITATYWYVRM